MGVGNPQSSPPVDTAVSETVSDVEITFKPYTTGKQQLVSAFFGRPDPPPDAPLGSVDVPTRPEVVSQGRHYVRHIALASVLHFSANVW